MASSPASATARGAPVLSAASWGAAPFWPRRPPRCLAPSARPPRRGTGPLAPAPHARSLAGRGGTRAGRQAPGHPVPAARPAVTVGAEDAAEAHAEGGRVGLARALREVALLRLHHALEPQHRGSAPWGARVSARGGPGRGRLLSRAQADEVAADVNSDARRRVQRLHHHGVCRLDRRGAAMEPVESVSERCTALDTSCAVRRRPSASRPRR